MHKKNFLTLTQLNEAWFSAFSSSIQGLQTPPKLSGLAFGSTGWFLGDTIVSLYCSNQCNMLAKTALSFFAWFTYSQGSSSMLNKQGPSLLVHWGVIFGRTPHVTAAFFKVADTSDARFRLSSSPGGLYHPLHAEALKAKEKKRAIDITGRWYI